MQKLLILLGIVAACSCAFSELASFHKFQKFVKDNNKTYKTLDEYTKRYHIFLANLKKIEDRNRSWEGVTKFMDLTEKEFREKYLNVKVDKLKANKQPPKRHIKRLRDDPPESYSWQDEGAVTPSRDMQNCDASYAFAAIGQFEVEYYARKKKMVPLSAQEIIDCDDMDSGCNGGEVDQCMTWVMMNGGMVSEESYPWKGTVGSCNYDPTQSILMPNSVSSGYGGDEEEMKVRVYEQAPYSNAFNGKPLQFYTGGIIDVSAQECDPDDLNLAGLIVGYGVENGQNYWIVQAFWGENWGEKGFFRIARGKATCGINGFLVEAMVQIF